MPDIETSTEDLNYIGIKNELQNLVNCSKNMKDVIQTIEKFKDNITNIIDNTEKVIKNTDQYIEKTNHLEDCKNVVIQMKKDNEVMEEYYNIMQTKNRLELSIMRQEMEKKYHIERLNCEFNTNFNMQPMQSIQQPIQQPMQPMQQSVQQPMQPMQQSVQQPMQQSMQPIQQPMQQSVQQPIQPPPPPPPPLQQNIPQQINSRPPPPPPPPLQSLDNSGNFQEQLRMRISQRRISIDGDLDN